MGLTREPSAGIASEEDIECVEKLAPTRFYLLDLTEGGIGTGIGGTGSSRQNRGVGVAGSKALDLDPIAIGGGESDFLTELPLDTEAGLDRIRRANVGCLADDVAGDGRKVSPRSQLLGGWLLKLHRVENDAIVELEGGWEIAADAVIKESRAETQNRLPFAWSVSERDARGQIVVVADVGDPVVAKTKRDLELWVDHDLVLKVGTHFIGPVEAATDASLGCEDVRCADIDRGVYGVVCEGGVEQGAQSIGVVVDGSLTDLGQLEAETNIVLSVVPTNNFVDMDCVFGSGEIGLSTTAGERSDDMDGAGICNAAGHIFVLLKGDGQLVD